MENTSLPLYWFTAIEFGARSCGLRQLSQCCLADDVGTKNMQRKGELSGRFDALFIDFYGTVCSGDRAAVASACEHIVSSLSVPLSAEQLALRWGEQFFEVIDSSNGGCFRTLHECECLSLSKTLAKWVGEVEPEPFIESIEAYWRSPQLHAEVGDVLLAIDLPTCCVSNADTEPLAMAIEKLDLRFDRVISSEQARHYKPHPEIFRQACQMMKVEPARVLHVGDSLHSDVEGAAKLGITTVWIRRADRIHDIGSVTPDFTITSLTQLLPLIER